ncbi:uncharacterized protein LOC105849775 [Hydra vulgaris]|uniref:uncharacterized protein LOC105849775 n=1 Tax=Hydra vulgaris TaxID=6087 RepID=UPI001F5EFCEE|nr:uncharacterized protein LOC105849775 [Hydra vulgaris]
MGVKLANFIYFSISLVWSSIIFITLMPDVKNFAYTKCVWKYNFDICDRFLGIEGGYRFTFSIVLFYLILSVVTINSNSSLALWIHAECWVLKVILLLATNVVGILIPFSRSLLGILYWIFLFAAITFIAVIFVLLVDASHAFRMHWIKKARLNADSPTCYMCTWLFVLHLATSLLYAISIDIVIAFFFFNNTKNCVNTFLFLSINVCICIVAFGISYYPSLRSRQSSSQIIFASIMFVVVYSTWLALSDPENEVCNMYGTIFTGSLLDSSVSFRSIVSLIIAIPPLIFLCMKDSSTKSYIKSLLLSANALETTWYEFPLFHLVMLTHSCFVLMSITNYYEPVFSVFKPIKYSVNHFKTSVIYFEGYNWTRFIMLSTLSTLMPILYIITLLVSIMRDCCNDRKVKDSKDEIKVVKSVMNNITDEFLYLEVPKWKALEMLRKNIGAPKITTQTYNKLDFMLLQCFRIKSENISFWHFPKNLSQTYFSGRNGSNACTIIALIFGRFFSRSDIPFQNTGYLDAAWLNLFHSCIEEGLSLYDSLVKDMGVLDLCIEEVRDRYGVRLNISDVSSSLPVSFESEVETVTILYQLQRLISFHMKQVVLLIHKGRTSAFLIYSDGRIVYADSHAFGLEGAVLISCLEPDLKNMVVFLKDILGSNDNRLATLTPVFYQDRFIKGYYSPFFETSQ